MGLFNKSKKTVDVHVLDEGEIQKKLYGNLRTKDIIEDPTSRYSSDTEVAKPAKSAAVPSPATGGPDLFSPSQGSVAVKSPKPQQAPPTEKYNSVSSTDKIKTWVREENQSVSDLSSEKQIPPTPVVEKEKRGPGFIKKTLLLLLAITAAVFQFFFVIIARFFGLFDLRKPRVRKAFFALSVMAVIALLFFGIHYLNVRRESAMQSSNRGIGFTPTEKVAVVVPPQEIVKEERALKVEAAPKSEGRAPSSVPEVQALAQATSDSVDSQRTPQQSVREVPRERTAPVAPRSRAVAPRRVYSIQVATYAAREDAERISNKLNESGLDTFVKALSRSSGRVYHCVFLGQYESFDNAEKSLNKFKSRDAGKPFQDSFIRNLTI